MKIISYQQVRAARALLGLDQKDVSESTKININQISAYERGVAGLSVKNIQKLTIFFQERGLEFIDHEGVRKKPDATLRTLNGKEGISDLNIKIMSL